MSKSERRVWNNKIRRQEELKKHVSLSIFTFCLILAFSFTANSFSSNARARAEDEIHKYYKSIIIEKGDTLWSIALQNINCDDDIMAYIKEVKKMNGLMDDNITEGMYLIIPYFNKAAF